MLHSVQLTALNGNVKGSSLAAGHPFAATGGRIIATAAKLINQKGSGSRYWFQFVLLVAKV